tara:strand:+ start:3197 stop:4474 length:1278 start_codon:yes stop_codon:yes gene_type:complete
MEPPQEIYKYFSPFLIGLLISTGIGLIIGLEREYNKLQGGSISGIRTFPIVCIAGFLLANLSSEFSNWVVIATIPSFLLFLGLDHFNKNDKHLQGHTTHLALFITFLLGMMISKHLFKEGLAVAVIVVTLLALKDQFKSTLKTITEQELFATIKFFILSLLILPFLPNQKFGPDGIFNLYEIGWVVVIVSILNFIGYFLTKYIGSRKGIIVTALLGGLISSTAVAWSFSSRSKENPELAGTYASGILIASAIMFPRLAIISYVFNPNIIQTLWLPFLLMFIVAASYSWWLIRNHKNNKMSEDSILVGNPLDILSALYFAIIFIVILTSVYYSNIYFGNKGLYFSAIISGFADTDAVTISVSKLAKEIDLVSTSAKIIVAATISNSLVKLVIGVIKGNSQMKRKLFIGYGAVLVVGVSYILLTTLI